MNKVKEFIATIIIFSCVQHQAISQVVVKVNDNTISFEENPRLNQVLDSIGLKQNWYWQSSKLFKLDSEYAEQKRDELLLQLNAITSDADSVEKLQTQIKGWKLATHMNAVIDYDLARYHRSSNPLFESGKYELVVTKRPTKLYVFGAVDQPTTIEYDNTVCIKNQLKQVNKTESADRNIVYAIQPNGKIREIPVAYWNHSCLQVMPGSQIFVPLAEHQWFEQNKRVNQLIAKLAVNRIVIE
ncbi:capsule biosynthesis GfcC family protein [Aliiglaciecola lipolytica]|uniref:Uncharacterized protein n=1 Tax=Aliiglaciecola lipolytica E3 TaxID=1127673 RepID=K6YW12_9ALTE|nr:capsule biosynthesis GfcC family protein [Aliiglaciecola lipolytica]GAC15440.1 hypothetical protein GLIP_2819 [Aliiglaciecola lipolytica E3]